MFGGSNDNQFALGDIWLFTFQLSNYDNGVWSQITPINQGPSRAYHASEFVRNMSSMFVYGGYSEDQKMSNDLWMYNVTGNYWTLLATLGGKKSQSIRDCIGDHSGIFALQ
jgi:hypothetical protein